jgi:hypothetical protein
MGISLRRASRGTWREVPLLGILRGMYSRSSFHRGPHREPGGGALSPGNARER